MNKVHYQVAGMGNIEDRTKLKNALNHIPGVQMTAIDMARGTIEVGYNQATSDEEIKNCIIKSGCTIERVIE